MKNIKTDILVVGAGTAGVAAAVGASRQGMKVLLIEKNDYAGGKATAAEVGTICGLYSFNKQRQAEYLVKGFAFDFAEELRVLSGTMPMSNSYGLQYLPYQVEAFKTLCEKLLRQNEVNYLFDASLQEVHLQQDSISHAIIKRNKQWLHIQAASVVDCTGHSQVSQLAGLPLIESDQYQAAAQVFTMAGVQLDQLSEQSLGMVLTKAMRLAVLDGKLAPEFERLYLVPGSLNKDMVSLKLGIPLAVTHQKGNLQQLADCGKTLVEKVCEYLIREVDIFHSAILYRIAPEPGVRVGYRSLGKYILQEDDVLGARKFTDAIANSGWPVEEWKLDKRVQMNFLPAGEYYQVPAGCLLSKNIDNLFFAGRNISATDAAIASARVMGICLQTGYAAGVLAAAKAGRRSVDTALQLIQQEQVY